MATLSQLYSLRYSSDGLRNRLTAACATAAQDVLNESTGTSNHEQRVKWAYAALANAPAMAESMMWGLIGNATIQTAGEAATDGDIQFVCNGLINTYAAGL